MGAVTARFLARVAGQLISMTKAIVPTKLLLRNVYRLLSLKKSWQDRLSITDNVQKDLIWWLESLDHWNGRAFKSVATEWLTLEVDASLEGWGSRLTDVSGHQKHAQGFWSSEMRQKHPNEREITAVLLSLKTFVTEKDLKSNSLRLQRTQLTQLSVYLQRTSSDLECGDTPVFRSLTSPSLGVGAATVSQILRKTLHAAGLADEYTARGFRAAGATAAIRSGCDPDSTRQIGRWASRDVFFNHYVYPGQARSYSKGGNIENNFQSRSLTAA
ncbi:Pol polyprotein [Elysia marginata]|uniref:Pol polyprotein n=1 Tax=Elysia marginata TaxID=1093978 RepID=A0AAV4HIA7_9GAST|nr:Pol polyprotein [Elysia marginata]